jgi:preprotein translocase subunit YajC
MPLVLIFVVFYFLMIRPQQQKMKQHREMVDNLKRGDQVMTGGGILGKVTKVEAGDQTVVVEIAPNVQVRVSRATITEVLGKPATNDNRVRAGAATPAAGGMGMGDIGARLQRFFKR